MPRYVPPGIHGANCREAAMYLRATSSILLVRQVYAPHSSLRSEILSFAVKLQAAKPVSSTSKTGSNSPQITCEPQTLGQAFKGIRRAAFCTFQTDKHRVGPKFAEIDFQFSILFNAERIKKGQPCCWSFGNQFLHVVPCLPAGGRAVYLRCTARQHFGLQRSGWPGVPSLEMFGGIIHGNRQNRMKRMKWDLFIHHLFISLFISMLASVQKLSKIVCKASSILPAWRRPSSVVPFRLETHNLRSHRRWPGRSLNNLGMEPWGPQKPFC